jgi:hypothetical protein
MVGGLSFVRVCMQTAAEIEAEGSTWSEDGFTYGALPILVGAPCREPLRWLEEFLSPAFRAGPRDGYAASVTLREDSQHYRDMLANRPQTGIAPLDCFVNDSHMVELPAWASGAGTTTAFQEGFHVLYTVDPSARSVAILSPEHNPQARTALMRVVRELAMNRSRADGGVFLHAAALAIAGRGLLIAGEKRAGKTTLLLYLLRATGADYVSNDRVLLPSPASATLRGMPTIVTVRPQTLAFFPGLRSELVTKSYFYRCTMAEAAVDQRPARPSSDGSFGLSPAQVGALLRVERRAECAPHVLLFPHVTGDASGGELRELAPGAAAARLRRALLSAELAKKTSDLVAFAGDSPVPDDAVDDMCRALTARVTCVECRLGAKSYEDGALAADCVRLLSS